MHSDICASMNLNSTTSMRVIVATSRGKELTPLHNPPHTWLRYSPGACIKDLTTSALEILEKHWYRYDICEPRFVYFVAGLPDLTTKEEWPNFQGRHQYQEVIFKGEVEDAVDSMKSTIREAAFRVRAAGAVPVFGTIVPSQLERWNQIRLEQHKTTHLLHFHRYREMQLGLLQATIYTNRFIHEINNQHGVVTPALAKKILFSRRSKYRFRHKLLVDGVHLAPVAVEDWLTRLPKVMDLNDEMYPPQLPLPPTMNTSEDEGEPIFEEDMY